MLNQDWDIAVIGAGIVGVATARALQRRLPGRRIAVLEREARPAAHQTGRNSGVVHAGVYYPPGSLKARFCREGAAATAAFCREHALPFEQCGKLITAVDASELPGLRALQQRARAHGLAVRWLDAVALRELEPAVDGRAALHVPATAITDYAAITGKLLQLFTAAGGESRLGEAVLDLRESAQAVHLETSAGSWTARCVVVCAGIMADRFVRMQGLQPDFMMLPFRGEYYDVQGPALQGLQRLIYPVPDPRLPFLGVHLTRHVDGRISAGPNAVLAPGRYAYAAGGADWRDLCDMARFPGTWRMLSRFWQAGLNELAGSWSRRVYLRRLRRYCPALSLQHLRAAPAGIRAQAVARDGCLLQDFHFISSRRVLHVCNAPSPAATSALPIAEHLADRLAQQAKDAFGAL